MLWLGGDDYEADRAAADQVIARPDVLVGVRARRGFSVGQMRLLVAEAGIRQFLDIGTGLPAGNNTHEVAQGIAPESRVVYGDNDSIVLLHAQALLTGSPQGATAYIDADIRDTRKILDKGAGCWTSAGRSR